MNDNEWKEFRIHPRSFLCAGDEVLLCDTSDMGKWRGKQGVVVKVNRVTISLSINGEELKVHSPCIAKFRRGDVGSIRKATTTKTQDRRSIPERRC